MKDREKSRIILDVWCSKALGMVLFTVIWNAGGEADKGRVKGTGLV